jgi:opacity protein-like surface antigen
VDFKVTWNNGFSVAAVGSLPIGERFALFGKGGIYYAKTTASLTIQGFPLSSGSETDTNTGAMVGLGASVDFVRNFGMRVEWERFLSVGGDHTGGESDFDFFSVGFVVRF